MSSSIDARCGDMRGRLEAFAAGRLRPTAQAEVQAHLLDCQVCAEAYGRILLGEVERGAIPLIVPPTIPPLELYDQLLRSGHNRFGTLWTAVRNAVQNADASGRAWAQSQIDQFRAGVDALARSAGPFSGALLTGGAIRTRGAVRTRGGVPSRPPAPTLTADVLTSESEPTGRQVKFQVPAAPAITADGHFTATFRTDSADYDSRLVVCTVTLPDGARISFGGTLRPVEGEPVREVRIDEADVPGPPRSIPLHRADLTPVVSLAILSP